jgi:hypothetical protein
VNVVVTSVWSGELIRACFVGERGVHWRGCERVIADLEEVDENTWDAAVGAVIEAVVVQVPEDEVADSERFGMEAEVDGEVDIGVVIIIVTGSVAGLCSGAGGSAGGGESERRCLNAVDERVGAVEAILTHIIVTQGGRFGEIGG